MSKCARCEKTVYPMEELRCLEKVWHKACFRCKECNVLLNLQNYKGLEKTPYCRVHVPVQMPTQVASTPEMKRVRKATQMQSNITYHAEFEKQKGHYTPVAMTPEFQRAREATLLASNVVYHGDLLKKADMDHKRALNKDVILAGSPTDEEKLRHAKTLVYESATGSVDPSISPGKQVGSILDYEPGPEKETESIDETTDAPEISSASKKVQLDSNENYEVFPVDVGSTETTEQFTTATKTTETV